MVKVTDRRSDEVDVVVIGGGAAGLSGALTLARARRSVLVIDAGAPRNAPAAGVHGLLALDGIPPADLLARGRREVRGYGGRIVHDEVRTAVREEDGFAVGLAGGGVRARRLLVTTGLVDTLPEVPGLRERWGRDVLHCPYCHGWEVRDRAVGVLATGPQSVHQALLFRQWTGDVVLFAHRTEPPAGEDAERLAALGVPVVTGEVAAVESAGDRLTGVRLADSTVVARDALAVATRMEARAGFLAGLGLRAVPHPAGFGEHLVTDPTGRTEAPGVWAAGNVTDLSAQVGPAAAAATFAAAQINHDLVLADADRAVAARRAAARA
nr:NAD(P)/FAD-dependent oxidoreductase [Streptomyces sp. ODS05-4]